MSDTQSSLPAPPKAGKVVGILNIILTGMGIFGGFISISMFGVIKSVMTGFFPQFGAEFLVMSNMIQSVFTIVIVIGIVQLAINGLGLAGGVGLLKRKEWSILLCNIYAIGTILLIIGNFLVVRMIFGRVLGDPMIIGQIPPEERFALDIMKNIIPLISGVFGLIFGSAYPVVVLALLNREKVRNYYNPVPSGTEVTDGE